MNFKKPVSIPLWAIIATGATVLLLLCGITGAAASKPEPETRTITKTEYKTKTVKDDSQTEEIEELKVQLETCQRSTLSASQAFIDMTNAFVALAEGASTFDTDRIEEANGMIEDIDSASVGSLARECDPDIASKISGLPE